MSRATRFASLVAAIAVAALACGGVEETSRRGRRGARNDEAPAAPAPAAPAPRRAGPEGTVTVNADGSFSPATMRVKPGDTVTFRLNDRGDSIVQAKGGAACVGVPWSPDVLAGPSPVAPSGIFSLGPFGNERGLRLVEGACRDRERGRTVEIGGRTLCASGDLGETLLDTWQHPEVTGVHVRMLWNQVEPARGRFDFAMLERELDRAVANGKLVSLSIKAGADGTPDWIFDHGVDRLKFRDGGIKAEGCGRPMELGDPTDAAYQKLWGELIDELGARIRSRADWYRALGYVRMGGVNLFSAEMRLPAKCIEGCEPCNTEVWAKAGYRPSKLLGFFDWQENRLAELFPGKSLSLQIIQAGFPRINEDGCWLVGDEPDAKTACLDGSVRRGADTLPRGADTTEQLIDRAIANLGPSVQIAHNGLGPGPTRGRCPTYQRHPARGPYTNAPDGCPNRWVLEAGARTRDQITGWQTNNEGGVGNLEELESALQNAWDNSDGVVVEVYEGLFLEAALGARKLPSGKTVGQWAELFHQRRKEMAGPKTPDPFPSTYSWTVPASAQGTITFFDPARCDPRAPKTGALVVER